MGNTIQLLPVASLLDDRSFFIPSYQRGYRWDEKQVKDLLNDIYAFALRSKGQNEFYCLQPLVVKQTSWTSNGIEKEGWELIDGQQRLTTIHLIISYLVRNHLRGETLEGDYGKKLYHIEYQVRSDSEKLLDSLDFEPKMDDNIDYYHIKKAYKHIEEWFVKDSLRIDEHYGRKSMPKDTREKVLKTLVYDKSNGEPEGIVQFIWYEVIEASSSEVDTFIRINMGKIPLTNAELIKALFLQNSNFDSSIAKFEQTKIASEWDRIEFGFQKDDFWFFLNEKDDKISRIEFIFDLIYHSESSVKERKTDNDATFRFFNQKFEGKLGLPLQLAIKSEWDKIFGCFLTFEEWYEDGALFHYIGFLIHCGTSVIDLYNEYKSCNLKSNFELKLKTRIKDIFKNVVYSKDAETFKELDVFSDVDDMKVNKNDIKNVRFELNFEDNKALIKSILLFLNIEQAAVQHKKMKYQYETNRDISTYRFPFDIFKIEKWDVEHIDSFTSNGLKDLNTQIEWLKTAIDDLQINEESELFKWVEDFGSDTGKSFDEIRGRIVDLAGEENNDDLKNSIGNLTLLDAETNRSYGNSLFCTKRKIVIKKDKKGIFIPNCTKMIFLKYFDITGTNRSIWGKEDMINYSNYIFETLEEYLPIKK